MPAIFISGQKGGVDIPGATFAQFMATESGEYGLEIKNSNQCSVKTTPVVVTVNPSPATPVIEPPIFTSICSGDSVRLLASLLNDVSYQWLLNGGVTGTNTNQLYAKTSGSYSVRVVNSFQCSDTSGSVALTVNPLPVMPSVSYGNTTICSGSAVTFTVPVNASNIYQWTKGGVDIPGATFAQFMATESGEYGLEIKNSNQCSVKTTPVVVTVNPSPATPVIEPPIFTAICSGDSVRLLASLLNDVSYQWLLNGGITGTNTNQLYAKTSGSYSVRVVNSFQCSDTSGSVALTVNPLPVLPSVSYGETTICSGSNVTFFVPNNSGYFYQWKNGNENIIGANTNQFLATLPGSYSLVISNSNSCAVQTNPVAVFVTEKPSKPTIAEVTNNILFCPDTEVELKVTNSSTFYTYLWKRSGVPIDVVKGKLNAGDYSVVVKSGSCEVESDILTLTTKPAPAKPAIYAKGPNVWLLACDNTTAVDYRWYYNDQLVLGAKSNQYVANQNLGNYYVEVGEGGECYTSSDVINIPSGNIVSSISALTADAIVVHPNPSSGLFNVMLGGMLSGTFSVEVVDAFGRMVGKYEFQDSDRFIVDLTGSPKGIYFCRIAYQNSFVAKKLVKQ